jgi:hypothetical protein
MNETDTVLLNILRGPAQIQLLGFILNHMCLAENCQSEPSKCCQARKCHATRALWPDVDRVQAGWTTSEIRKRLTDSGLLSAID